METDSKKRRSISGIVIASAVLLGLVLLTSGTGKVPGQIEFNLGNSFFLFIGYGRIRHRFLLGLDSSVCLWTCKPTLSPVEP